MNYIQAIQTRYKGYVCRTQIKLGPGRNTIQARADLTGFVFGRLTVKEDLGPDGKGFRFWGCLCECGELIAVRSRELKRGHTKSCRCLFLENLRKKGGFNKLAEGQSAFNQLFSGYKKSARERGYSFGLSEGEFRSVTGMDCHYCGSGAVLKFKGVVGTNGSFYGNGIDRVDNLIGYERENVVPCCTQCNIAKGVLSLAAFKEWALRLSARFEHGESGRT